MDVEATVLELFAASGLTKEEFSELLSDLEISDKFSLNVPIENESLVILLKKFDIITTAKKGFIRSTNFEAVATAFAKVNHGN
jgi:hypothetical protein